MQFRKIVKIDGQPITHCEVPHDEAGLVWDGITFAFLLFQRRIFNSYYFFHIRGETEVQALLASRYTEFTLRYQINSTKKSISTASFFSSEVLN